MVQTTRMRLNNSPAARKNRSEGQRDRQPREANTGEPSGELGVTGLAPGATAMIAANPAPKKTNNLFTLATGNVSRQAVAKMEAMGVIRQQLAEAADMFAAGDDEATKANEIADNAALRLYQARVNGLISADEVTAALGDVFGYKVTAKGEPSKTPNGQGEVIRKRLVRAVAAAEFVTNGDGGRFFEGLPEKKIAEVVSRLDNNDVSLFRAYDVFAEIKRENATRTNPAFDPKRVAAFVEALSEDGAAAVVRSNAGLVAAYGALIDVLMVIGETAEEAKAA